MWHVDPLIGNDREISNYKTTVVCRAITVVYFEVVA
jgi:hypothetical protein